MSSGARNLRSKRGREHATEDNDAAAEKPSAKRPRPSGQYNSIQPNTGTLSDDSEIIPSQPSYPNEEYTVGWICALPIEMAAAKGMMDEEHGDPQVLRTQADQNTYTLGRVGKFNVAVACLPKDEIGASSAAAVARDMLHTFPSIRVGLLVGIGAGIPDYDSHDVKDIRLGDVVVSSDKENGGVIAYDFGKKLPDGSFKSVYALDRPPRPLRTAMAKLETEHETRENKISLYIAQMLKKKPFMKKKGYGYPEQSSDRLFQADYRHVAGRSCAKCDSKQQIERDPAERLDQNPAIHYGVIATSNAVIKHAPTRDEISQKHRAICLEMEAAGLMNHFPCLVIRGISDYADSHKNDKWQPYAAAAAAAYAKELLDVIPAASVTGMPTINEKMEKISAELERNTTSTQNIEAHVLTAEEERILDWLSSSNFSMPQNNAQSSRTSRTGEWLLEKREYKKWRDSSPGLLWLYGGAGCGKTILSSTIIEDIRKVRPQQIAYWYFQFSNFETQNICNMLRSLLRQLCSSAVDTSIRRLWDQHRKSGSIPSFTELSETLWGILRALDHDVFIVLDALDECPRPERHELLFCLNELRERGNAKVHILATSRREPDIEDKLNSLSSVAVDIENLVAEDIKLFVEDQLSKNQKLHRWDNKSKKEILDKLTGVNERRFRWADLQIKRLQDCIEKPELVKALNTIPKDLESTYEEALRKIDPGRKKPVQKILMWLTSSLRPMSLEEIAAVVSLPFPDDVFELCSSLLVTLIDDDRNGQTIKLAHFSVKEYLITTKLANQIFPWYRFSAEQAHILIAEMNLTYLLEGTSIQSGEKDIPGSLFRYSAEFWPLHALEAFNSTFEEFKQLQELVETLFNPDHSKIYNTWLETYDHDRPNWDQGKKDHYPQPLYYASLLGLRIIVKALLDRSCRIEKTEGLFQNAINAAAIGGYLEIVEDLWNKHEKNSSMLNLPLVARNIRRNVKGIFLFLLSEKKERIGLELVDATANNYQAGQEVLMLLLEQRGADLILTNEMVETIAGRFGKDIMMLLLEQRGADVTITEEVVKAAAGNGKKGEEVMMVLLEQRGADMAVTEKIVKTIAGRFGKEAMMVLLEQRGADVAVTEEVMKAAAGNLWSGKEVMMVLLEQRGADVAITEEVVKAIVSTFGKEIIMVLLEQRGADVAVTEEVIKAAAGNLWSGKEIIMVLLEQRGADVAVTEEIVKIAAENWWSGKEIIIILLEQCVADVAITEEVVKAIAGRFGKEVMMVLLEQRGADVAITEEVVKAAARNEKNGKEVMMVLLEQRGADVAITEGVVKAAAGNGENGKEVMMVLLEQRGADVAITEEVVKAAAGNGENGKEVMMVLLEQREADVVITDNVVMSAARNSGQATEVMTLLLDQPGTDVVMTEKVVKAAAGNRHGGKELITLLLDHRPTELRITENILIAAATSGVKETLHVIQKRCESNTLTSELSLICQLFHSARIGNTKDVSRSIEAGINLNLKDTFNGTPLWYAAAFGQESIVRSLLQIPKVDLDSKSNISGFTALFVAADKDFENIVELLLEYGADPNIGGNDGRTLLDIAKSRAWTTIVELLKRWQI